MMKVRCDAILNCYKYKYIINIMSSDLFGGKYTKEEIKEILEINARP